jgi:hypothetical protein
VQDKAWATVSPYTNEIHITWTEFDAYGSSALTDSSRILYSKSSDNGNSWSAPKRISFYAGDCIDSDNTVEGAVPAIGPGGEVYVAWAGPKGLVFQKSLDGGLTWLPKEQVIRPIPGGWDYNVNGLQRCNGMPFTACDLSSSAYKGTIYINWSDQQNGPNDGDIWLIKSTDGGNSWSQPVRVNDDQPGKQQFMSAMTVDQATGYVYVLFYDRRNFSTGTATDVYMGVSKDGGATFSNYKINANTFNPTGNVFFGDYIGISAHQSIVRPIWMQLEGGALSVYTALINPSTVGIYESRGQALTLEPATPNPFKTETTVEFALARKTRLNIQLVDNAGKLVHQFATRKSFGEGKHQLVVSVDQLALSPGVYYLVFYGDEKSVYAKLVVSS